MLNNLQWEQDTDVQHAQKLHNYFNKIYEQNNVAEVNLQILQKMSVKTFIKSTI